MLEDTKISEVVMNALLAISPIDGRYNHLVTNLRPIFSEMGFMQKRLLVETEWFIFLSEQSDIQEIPSLSTKATSYLRAIVQNFSESDAEAIKKIEAITNHDVKAVEYFLKQKMAAFTELAKYAEFVHFACTSEDINNLSYALMLKQVTAQVLLPQAQQLIDQLQIMRKQYAAHATLSRTHGQPASPSTVGKEFANVIARLQRQYQQLQRQEILGKLNGAVGNFNAHQIAYPQINWPQLAENFVTKLGLIYNAYTTQIEPHDYIAELLQNIMRFNTILIDLSRDCWAYISLDYFKQKHNTKEVGSSTMPHKINPIDFENAEGNLSIANAIFDFLANRLPISRWQRDLVDSTLLRNLGVGFAHTAIAYQVLMRGLQKIILNETKLAEDLHANWAILTEAIQTVMRRYQLENPYEQLKALSRGKELDEQQLKTFIMGLALPAHVKEQLLVLTPAQYIGFAEDLALALKD